ncbi:hypothetical protein K788_0002478 [Paraburkholderia caribensis MBA4]|uniref:Uncharacterized protein n=1 Tax=Paraburkholderia caribensis MBA4 TaxID=1323664 RepID=A0A0N7JTZ3_9BURK|nr:hypothetical protein K788_0002478 [Paraburkholderia caribensis MBA4]
MQVAVRRFAIDSFERFRAAVACGVSTGLTIARDPVRRRDVARLPILPGDIALSGCTRQGSVAKNIGLQF